jgi:hypothetical protein
VFSNTLSLCSSLNVRDQRVQVTNLHAMKFSPSSRHFILLRSKYSPHLRRHHWIFQFTSSGPGASSASDGRVPGIFLGVKGGRRVRLTSSLWAVLSRKCESFIFSLPYIETHNVITYSFFTVEFIFILNSFLTIKLNSASTSLKKNSQLYKTRFCPL